MRTLPFPSSTSIPIQPTPCDLDDLYPINILSSPPRSKEIELETMVLTYPIHIHTPQSHIGTIHSSSSSQKIDAVDLFRFLQTFARGPLDAHANYSELPQQMKAEVEVAFMRRNGQSSSTVSIWETFALGQPTHNGPTGEDLLLGNADIWGMEGRSIFGYSIIHLA